MKTYLKSLKIYLLFISLIFIYVNTKRNKVSAPFTNINNLSDFKFEGNYKIKNNPNSVNIYSNQNTIIISAILSYYQPIQNEIQTSEFFFNNLKSDYNIKNAFGLKYFVFDHVESLELTLKNAECRFPIFFYSKNESVVINRINKGSLIIEFEQNSNNFLEVLNTIEFEVGKSFIIPKIQSSNIQILYYLCPFFESEENDFSFSLENSVKKSLEIEESSFIASSIINIIENDFTILTDKVQTYFADQSVVHEDVLLRPHGISYFEHDELDNFKITFDHPTQYFIIYQDNNNKYNFSNFQNINTKITSFELKLKNQEIIKKIFFIFKNLTENEEEFHLLIGKIIICRKFIK